MWFQISDPVHDRPEGCITTGFKSAKKPNKSRRLAVSPSPGFTDPPPGLVKHRTLCVHSSFSLRGLAVVAVDSKPFALELFVPAANLGGTLAFGFGSTPWAAEAAASLRMLPHSLSAKSASTDSEDTGDRHSNATLDSLDPACVIQKLMACPWPFSNGQNKTRMETLGVLPCRGVRTCDRRHSGQREGCSLTLKSTAHQTIQFNERTRCKSP